MDDADSSDADRSNNIDNKQNTLASIEHNLHEPMAGYVFLCFFAKSFNDLIVSSKSVLMIFPLS